MKNLFHLRLQNKRLKVILAHVAGWVLYAFLVFGATMVYKPEITIWNALTYIIPLVITFYLSLFCLNLHHEKGIWWSVASFFIVFIVMASVGYLYIYFILPGMGMVLYTTRQFSVFMAEAVFAFIRIFSFALIYFYVKQTILKERVLRKIINERAQQETEKARLREQKLVAEKERLKYEQIILRNQINPHFLYNTLNTLFSQALNNHVGVADNILKLSHLMRYSIESLSIDSGKVPVKKELDNLQTFIDIHNFRFKDRETVRMEITGNTNGQLVPPFCLIGLVENAFKYGELKDPAHPIVIKINFENDSVHFQCRNKVKQTRNQFPSYSIGLTNLRERLKTVFEDKHTLNIREEDGFFALDLILNH